jgi:hypothetical protein
MDKIPNMYRQGKSDNIDLEEKKAGWNWRKRADKAMAEEDAGGGAKSNNTQSMAPVSQPPVNKTVTPARRLGPDVMYSPGAADVLAGRAKAGFNPGPWSAATEESDEAPHGLMIKQGGVTYTWNPKLRRYE